MLFSGCEYAETFLLPISQIVQIAGRDGPEYGKLCSSILVAEHVQRPVANCCSSKMRMVEAASEIRVERDRFDSSCLLFGPAQNPGRDQPFIGCVP